MDLGLAGRVAFVTGSSRGIGRAAALAFAREGARVVVGYHSDRESAEGVVADIARAGGEALAVACDLAVPDTMFAACQRVLAKWSQIDVLVNNAVQWGTRPPWQQPLFEDVPLAEWRDFFRANSEGAYVAIQAVLGSMRARGWGRIVNISSGVAVDGLPGTGAYAAAKAALHGLTRSLSKELGPAGILVNVVMPGATLTERMRDVLPQALRDQLERSSPIRRLLPPEEVVPTIVFLASAANTAVTGEVVRASGGIS